MLIANVMNKIMHCSVYVLIAFCLKWNEKNWKNEKIKFLNKVKNDQNDQSVE